MLNLFSNKKIVNIVIDDYVIRMVDQPNGTVTQWKNLKEKLVPAGLLERGRIVDEIEFYHFIKDTVREWGIKKRNVRFYVPDSLVIMKKVTYPANLEETEIKGHFIMELGRTLYLPFENPIFDIYPIPTTDGNEEREGLLFAVPEEEIKKYTEIFDDCGLTPIAADIRAIGVYRFYQSLQSIDNNDAYLFLEVNLDSVLVSIFSHNRPEFLRYMDLEVQLSNWNWSRTETNFLQWEYKGEIDYINRLIDDQITEIERILSFYRYSIHKGERAVSKIILLGDIPNMNTLYEKLQSQLSLSIELLDANLPLKKMTQVPRSFIPAVGLAMRGGSERDS
ncbi:pilus assembly protein PilM [Caldibacillus lycopersici]|uniref:Pilus assembly protein PilM n=1 Tax=Perspicuibacillus lycopersici TaxID=1325689 RepID=A0AAE3LMX2_9BACI|nr:pilus assembly protein PilM [Perspicuibacillus lycopersici]MCU9614020.1 pilus assembly protein PilM [Perspicuibacillus lycopersici]